MRYAVTGATGWLGAAAVAHLRRRGEDVVGFASSERDGWLALDALPEVEHDVLLHFAYVTREFAALRGHDAYVAANAGITATVLRAVVRHRPRVAYASSGAVHLGDDLRANPYGVLKRLDEHVLRDATDGRCCVVRVYNVAGPHVTKPRGFALTDLILQAQSQPRLAITAARPVVRSFVDVDDLAALMVAAAGEDLLLETAGAEEVEVGELAARIAPGMPVDRPVLDPALGADRYVGDGAAFAAACDRHAIVLRGLDEQIARTRAYLCS